MVSIGKGIGLAGLLTAGAALEIWGQSGNDGSFLIFAGILWIVFGDWNPRAGIDEEEQAKRLHMETMVRELPESERTGVIQKYFDEAD